MGHEHKGAGMTNTKNYEDALEILRNALSQAQLPPNFKEVTSNRELVLDRYHPAFQFDTIQQLSEETFRSFLYFENNHHWSGLYRKALRLCQNMPALRSALATLLNPTLPLAERWNQSVRKLPGLGKALATAILIVSSPNEFGVWNNTSEKALRQLNLWPEFPRGSYSGEKYEIINQLLNHLATDLDIDLWTLDALMWGVISKDVNAGQEDTPIGGPTDPESDKKKNTQVPDGISFESIANSLKTIKEYRDYSDPEGIGWIDYVYEIFHVLGFSTEKIDSRLFFLKDMGNMIPQALVLYNFPREDKAAIAPGISWDSYLRYAANYYEIKWGILTNGLQLQVFDYGNQRNDTQLLWSNLDETIKNQNLEGFYSLHKTLTSLKSQKADLEKQNTTPETLREYWKKRSHPKSMAVVDMVIDIVREISEPEVTYTQSRIAIGTSGQHFIWCHPRNAVPHLRMGVRVGQDLDNLLTKAVERGIQCNRSAKSGDRIRFVLTAKDVKENKDFIREVVETAEELSRQ
jgi:hypothetical protein